jgi:hypothetical protein
MHCDFHEVAEHAAIAWYNVERMLYAPSTLQRTFRIEALAHTVGANKPKKVFHIAQELLRFHGDSPQFQKWLERINESDLA